MCLESEIQSSTTADESIARNEKHGKRKKKKHQQNSLAHTKENLFKKSTNRAFK